jgi:tetratricopeptide (TPR) repeat protein
MRLKTLFSKARLRAGLTGLAANGYARIFTAALLLRAAYLAGAFAHNELIAHPMVDAAVYVNWARDILAGKWLWYDAMNYTPGFPAWLACWIGLLGWHPAAHFAIFHVLGAVQSVLIGKTAELLWNRRTGLVTALLAAAYWPLIVYEATYYAEAFAIFNLTLVLFLVVRWSRKGGGPGWLAWAGFHLGCSILARANAILCAPLLACWVMWCVWHQADPAMKTRRMLSAATAILLPPLLLLGPVVAWNWNLTGRPMLRTLGWLSVYLGNDPDRQLLAVPVGERWEDLMYQPIRADKIEIGAQEDYWRDEVRRIITERPGEWSRLQLRKALMLAGRFEVSQEVDIGIFRSASGVLNMPLWPGWGTVAPLALLALCAMGFSGSARRGLPLALCGAAYFSSIIPVMVAARYRLPAVVTLLPLAGWAAVWLAERVRAMEWRAAFPALAVLGLAGALVWPDWLGMSEKKIINEWFLIGIKRAQQSDETGALAAFEQGAAWNPADPDCPLRMGEIRLERGEVAKAKALFQMSHEKFARGHAAILGLGECALAEGRPAETLSRARCALEIAPNNMDALNLASRAFMALGDWPAMAKVCRQMRSYPTHPAPVAFSEAWAWIRAGRSAEALAVYDTIAATRWFSALDRARASFLGGALAWRLTHDRSAATKRWEAITRCSYTFFTPLARMLISATPAELPAKLDGQARKYADYALGLVALEDGRMDEARARFESALSIRHARTLGAADQDVLEIWSLEDVVTPFASK